MKQVVKVVLIGLVLLVGQLADTGPRPVAPVYAAVDCTAAGIICKSGVLTSNETWTSANVYVLTGDVTVTSGVTLTIQEGTVVKFVAVFGAGFPRVSLNVNGRLDVNGTPAKKVYFTSNRDDGLEVGGDTNGTSSEIVRAGDWGAIYFNSGSSGSISNAEIRYAGVDVIYPKTGAVHITGSSPTITNLTVKNSYWAAISALPTDTPQISGFTSQGTPVGGLGIRGGNIATDTIWSNTGIAYILTDDVTVVSGVTLTIQEGVVVKFVAVYGAGFARVSLNVDGQLDVNGTPTNKVYFTSNRDDGANVGGDTNGTASEIVRAGDWGAIYFNSGSSGSISNAEIRYAGVDVIYPKTGAVHITGSSPTITNLTVKNSDWAAISTLPTDMPQISGFTSQSTPVGGLGIRGGTINTDTIWSNTGIAYILTGDVTVANGVTLTIQPGVVVKFVDVFGNGFARVSLNVDGQLDVNGTPTNKVYFTSNRDEGPGGDTNGTPSQTAIAGDWGAIYFNSGSSGSISNAEIHYAGIDGNHIRGAVHIDGGSVALDGVTFNKTHWYPIRANVDDQPTLNNISFLPSSSPQGLILYGNVINQDVTWNQTELVHVLANDLTVSAGQTLTIAPGMIIKLVDNADIFVEGTLTANGTASQKIYFTSIHDDTIGGDTNGNGGGTAPAAGNWKSIQFRQGSSGSISYAEIRYGGNGSTNGAVHVASAAPTISNSILQNNTVGVYSTGDGALPVVSSSDFFYNSQFAAVAAGTGAILAANNWWGDRLGPNSGGSNPAGQAVQGNVTVSGWGTAPYNFTNGSKTISASILVTNTVAIYASGSEAVVGINNCTRIDGNRDYGARAFNHSLIDAPLVWWGGSDGPNDGLSGSGDEVDGNVVYTPWAADPNCATTGGVGNGTLQGRVTDSTSFQAVGGIRVQLYRLENGSWQAAGLAFTGMDGSYSVSVLNGDYRVHFIDPLRRYRSQYYNRVPDFDQASTVKVKAGITQNNIDAVLESILSPPVVSQGCGRVTIDPNTRRTIIAFPRGCRGGVEIIFTLTCANGAAPTAVDFQIDGVSFPMTTLGSNQYKVNLQLPDDLPGSSFPYSVQIMATCGGNTEIPVDGEILQYDPSGLITDQLTGDSIEGAVVNLYRLPGATPDSASQVNDCRTTDTRPTTTSSGPFGNWSGLPAVTLDDTHWLNPALSLINSTAEISPTLNPQITGKDGYYGWDVVTGCWYVQVQAAGYDTLVSPLVGVPPAVTDLDLRLTPAGSNSGGAVYIPLIIKGGN